MAVAAGVVRLLRHAVSARGGRKLVHRDDLRPAFEALGADVDEFVLSLRSAPSNRTRRSSVPHWTGGARDVGCGFALVDPLPTAQRLDGLRNALAGYGLDL